MVPLCSGREYYAKRLCDHRIPEKGERKGTGTSPGPSSAFNPPNPPSTASTSRRSLFV